MGKTDWIVGQWFFWVLALAIVLAGVVGIRRAGAVLAAHQAGLVGGRAALGPQQGLAQADYDLALWWGRAPDGVEVVPDPPRRSVQVRVRGVMRTLFGGLAGLGADSFQRWEDFYPGPPDEFE